MGDDDREVLGHAVVEDGRDRLRTGLVVGQHVAPGAEQRDVGLAVGQRLGQSLPAIDGAQDHRPFELSREVIGERAVGGVVLVLVGLEQADAELQRRTVCRGRCGRDGENAEQGEQGAEFVHGWIISGIRFQGDAAA